MITFAGEHMLTNFYHYRTYWTNVVGNKHIIKYSIILHTIVQSSVLYVLPLCGGYIC
jgi:hypothetical protein